MNSYPNLYEQDFYAWTLHTAELLRQRHFDELDVERWVEELETMSCRDRHELVSRLKILLGHLLKWQFQPHHRRAAIGRNSVSVLRRMFLPKITVTHLISFTHNKIMEFLWIGHQRSIIRYCEIYLSK